MLFYNLFKELALRQLFLAFFYGIMLVAILLKKKPLSNKQWLMVLFGGVVIALLSALSVIGGEPAGSNYSERFGWPLQFRNVDRDLESQTLSVLPVSFIFSASRFVIDVVFWSFFPLAAILWNNTTKKEYRRRVLIAALPIGLLLLSGLFSFLNHQQEVQAREEFLEGVHNGSIVPLSVDDQLPTKVGNRESASSPCDLSSLCVQESVREGGIFGVAELGAHYVGTKTFDTGLGGPETCPMMAIDSLNYPDMEKEIGVVNDGQVLFPISQDEVVRFQDTTIDAPASLVVYISERVGRDTGPCSIRVHVVN